jgi:hypothetical protein
LIRLQKFSAGAKLSADKRFVKVDLEIGYTAPRAWPPTIAVASKDASPATPPGENSVSRVKPLQDDDFGIHGEPAYKGSFALPIGSTAMTTLLRQTANGRGQTVVLLLKAGELATVDGNTRVEPPRQIRAYFDLSNLLRGSANRRQFQRQLKATQFD